VAVLPDGDVLNFLTEIKNFSFTKFAITLRSQRSTDKGRSFVPADQGPAVSRINTTAGELITGMFTPDLLIPVRDASRLFDVAVDRKSAAVSLVRQDKRFRPFGFEGFTLGDEVAFAMSTDGGRSWSPPIRGAFDYADAPFAGVGLFRGDYMGLAGGPGAGHALFGIADGQDRTSLVTRRISLP
jgi:hypothetical protein